MYMRAGICTLLWFTLVHVPLVNGDSLSSNAVGVSIAAVVSRLQDVQVADGDPRIPLSVRTNLMHLKKGLLDLVLVTYREQPDQTMDLHELQRRIAIILGAKGTCGGDIKELAARGSSDGVLRYADHIGVALQRFPDRPNIIAATTIITLPCGEDSSLYLLEEKNDALEVVLAQAADAYESIVDAQAFLSFDIGTTRDPEGWYLVTANISPWCSSNWQLLRYSVIVPASGEAGSTVILKGSDKIYLGVPPPAYRLKVKNEHFILEYSGGEPAPDGTAGIRLLSYRIRGNRAEPILP